MTKGTKATAGPAATAAAEWWAERVGSPVFRNTDDRSTGEERRGSDIAGMFATLLADRNPVTSEAAAKLVAALAPVIQQAIDRGYGCTLGVDYGPDMELAKAAQAAGISTSRFPWKTVQWAQADHVTASLGYGAPTRLVWASDDWLANRPACGSQHYDEAKYRAAAGRYHGEPFRCSLPKHHEEKCRYDTAISLCSVCGAPEDWPSHERSAHPLSDDHVFTALPVGEQFAGASA